MLMSRSIAVTQRCSVLWEPPSCQRPSRACAFLTLASLRQRHCGSGPELSPANCQASTTSSPRLLVPMMCGHSSRRRPSYRQTTCCNKRGRSEEHTSELQSPCNLVCRLLLEKKKWKLLIFML